MFYIVGKEKFNQLKQRIENTIREKLREKDLIHLNEIVKELNDVNVLLIKRVIQDLFDKEEILILDEEEINE